MKTYGVPLIACIAALTACAPPAFAEEKADQFKRDPVRIAEVKTIALAPVVVQLRFDGDARLPDPNRMAARCAAASRLPAMLEEKLRSGPVKLLPVETLPLALKQIGLQPTDLYITKVQGSWDSPCEKITNKKADEALLLKTKSDMKSSTAEVTLFRFRWHDMPDTCVGIAAFKDLVFAPLDLDRITALGTQAGADSVLLMQVEDMETIESAGLLEAFKSTRLHVHASLVATKDGAILWQAHARGVQSQKQGWFTGARAYKGEDRKAIECAAQAVEMLLDSLLNGNGKPASL